MTNEKAKKDTRSTAIDREKMAPDPTAPDDGPY